MKVLPWGLLVVTVLVLHEETAQGQPSPEIPRLGVLLPGASSSPRHQRGREAFEQELQKLGYMQGKTIVIEYRYGRRREFPSELAADLVHLKVSVIVTSAPSIARSAVNATKTIPIVMVSGGGNPVRRGLVKSLVRPGGNITGLSSAMDGVAGKMMEIFIEAFLRSPAWLFYSGAAKGLILEKQK